MSCSSDVSPEFREYERTVTTVVNAYLRPRCRGYLAGLEGLAGEVLVMTSAGGLIPTGEAADLPVALLLSGPAGGVVAGSAAAVAAGFEGAITFDMGGTSTDVCLIQGGVPEPAAGPAGGRLPHPPAVARHPHHRRRRRLHRPHRPRRGAGRRAGERRRRPRAGVLRPGR